MIAEWLEKASGLIEILAAVTAALIAGAVAYRRARNRKR